MKQNSSRLSFSPGLWQIRALKLDASILSWRDPAHMEALLTPTHYSTLLTTTPLQYTVNHTRKPRQEQAKSVACVNFTAVELSFSEYSREWILEIDTPDRQFVLKSGKQGAPGKQEIRGWYSSIMDHIEQGHFNAI
jgi:hypothetical protein